MSWRLAGAVAAGDQFSSPQRRHQLDASHAAFRPTTTTKKSLPDSADGHVEMLRERTGG